MIFDRDAILNEFGMTAKTKNFIVVSQGCGELISDEFKTLAEAQEHVKEECLGVMAMILKGEIIEIYHN